jgi:hypothetical protein
MRTLESGLLCVTMTPPRVAQRLASQSQPCCLTCKHISVPAVLPVTLVAHANISCSRAVLTTLQVKQRSPSQPGEPGEEPPLISHLLRIPPGQWTQRSQSSWDLPAITLHTINLARFKPCIQLCLLYGVGIRTQL